VDLDLLEQRVAELGEPAYRARQAWDWAARGAEGYDAMTNLPRALREMLTGDVPFSTLVAEDEQRARDGTVKTLFKTADGHPVEAVLMRYRDGRRSVCVSSQSGCPLTCTFCATGRMAYGRNLTAWEILDQVLHFRRTEPVNHLVFMGMGEPFMNVDAVLAAARRLPDVGITNRRTTISTVGWLPGLTRFVEEVTEPVRLALSLHSADPGVRSELMPVNDRYPLPDVVAVCRGHWQRTKRRVFVEYVMLAGVNDSPAQARLLAGLLGRDAFKVNLIPYNPTGFFDGSPRAAIDAFKAELDRARIPATVRLTRGRDIAAACGQLVAETRTRPARLAMTPESTPQPPHERSAR
jgi:23S rRNA (adenine2503-C2)-methyltransferase